MRSVQSVKIERQPQASEAFAIAGVDRKRAMTMAAAFEAIIDKTVDALELKPGQKTFEVKVTVLDHERSDYDAPQKFTDPTTKAAIAEVAQRYIDGGGWKGVTHDVEHHGGLGERSDEARDYLSIILHGERA